VEVKSKPFPLTLTASNSFLFWCNSKIFTVSYVRIAELAIMKIFCPTILPWIAAIFGSLSVADPTWPSSIDELEDVMFLNTGYRSRGFGALVTPCSSFPPGTNISRNTASEWLRVAFHDMATTNVYFAPHGGIDASIAYELNSGENLAPGLATSLTTYSGFFNSRLSVSDMVALGVYASVRACGGPVIPMRGGRVDATKAGPIGVPQPENAIGTFNNQFLRMGFNQADMIRMVACGYERLSSFLYFSPPAPTAQLFFDSRAGSNSAQCFCKKPSTSWKFLGYEN
jgi:hypothetical protein